MKQSRKKYIPLVLLFAGLLILSLHTVFFKSHTTSMLHHAALAPFTKDEQQALIATQEQEDERGDAGPLVAKVSARAAENAVLNLGARAK